MADLRFSVICPFYNEEENLKEFSERLFRVLEQSVPGDWEVIFVNDGSVDGSERVIKQLISPRVSLFNLEHNQGLSTAVYAGLQAAKGESLIMLDTDLQNPPEEIPKLLKQLPEADMVTGVRSQRQDSWLRKLSSRIANGVRRKVLGDTIVDSGCSLRVFKRSVIRCFYPYKNIHRYFPGIAQIEGFKVLQVSVEHHPRLKGKTKYNIRNRLWIGLWDVLSVKWIVRRRIKYKLRGVNTYV